MPLKNTKLTCLFVVKAKENFTPNMLKVRPPGGHITQRGGCGAAAPQKNFRR